MASAGEVKSLAVLARQHTTLALNTLAAVARKGQGEAAKVSAAVAILDRGYGRPTQSVEHAGPGGTPIKFDLSTLGDEQLTQLRSILGSLAVTGGGGRRDTAEGGGTER